MESPVLNCLSPVLNRVSTALNRVSPCNNQGDFCIQQDEALHWIEWYFVGGLTVREISSDGWHHTASITEIYCKFLLSKYFCSSLLDQSSKIDKNYLAVKHEIWLLLQECVTVTFITEAKFSCSFVALLDYYCINR